MDSVYFKTASGGSVNTYSAAFIRIYYTNDETTYTQVGGTQGKEIHGSYMGWQVTFGFLTQAQMDYLEELMKYETPQFSTNGSTYYTVIIKSVNPRVTGGTIDVIKAAKET